MMFIRLPWHFFGEGLSLQAKQRSAPPKKTTGLPLAGPGIFFWGRGRRRRRI
jgi:hypothetical protein